MNPTSLGRLRGQLIRAVQRSARESKGTHHLFETFLTQPEYTDMVVRLEIVRALIVGRESQRSIAARLGVSIATITRWSHEYQRNPKKIETLLQKFKVL